MITGSINCVRELKYQLFNTLIKITMVRLRIKVTNYKSVEIWQSPGEAKVFDPTKLLIQLLSI